MRRFLLGLHLTLLAGACTATAQPTVPPAVAAAACTSASHSSRCGCSSTVRRRRRARSPTWSRHASGSRCRWPTSASRSVISTAWAGSRTSGSTPTATAAGGVSVRFDLVPLRSVERSRLHRYPRSRSRAAAPHDRRSLRRAAADSRAAEAARTLDRLVRRTRLSHRRRCASCRSAPRPGPHRADVRGRSRCRRRRLPT